ncbi:MAG: pentapeptide repeat-containing protein [Sandaracinus sp.]|nr:pentapeptide repeat-containing protein [Sandaracinus sp.]MCB9612774.1 pentapeptide repeat-containing protein [Sandaracinus sp.]MCB9618243.1 pentapeptide repeat-containing protein [Sandaracinus sp.]MCB9636914.1 pentapeptide repeat-containing protein [Sandaracinus sp.]
MSRGGDRHLARTAEGARERGLNVPGRHARLRHARLRHARLRHARLRHARLRHARLRHGKRLATFDPRESCSGVRRSAPTSHAC